MINEIKFSLDTNIYPKDAVLGASYVFIDKSYVYLDLKRDKIEVILKSKTQSSKKETEAIRGEFMNELLNYTVRINLLKYNKKIREYIVERALYSSVQNDEQLSEDEFDDPLGIAVSWEEKYGDKKKNIKSQKSKKDKKK